MVRVDKQTVPVTFELTLPAAMAVVIVSTLIANAGAHRQRCDVSYGSQRQRSLPEFGHCSRRITAQNRARHVDQPPPRGYKRRTESLTLVRKVVLRSALDTLDSKLVRGHKWANDDLGEVGADSDSLCDISDAEALRLGQKREDGFA